LSKAASSFTVAPALNKALRTGGAEEACHLIGRCHEVVRQIVQVGLRVFVCGRGKRHLTFHEAPGFHVVHVEPGGEQACRSHLHIPSAPVEPIGNGGCGQTQPVLGAQDKAKPMAVTNATGLRMHGELFRPGLLLVVRR
jgi:hypothetical protein